MKKFLLLLSLMLFVTNLGIAQELNTNAKLIKEKYNNEYESNFKFFALKQWKEDYVMVVYEINKQSDAYIELINKLESIDVSLLYDALLKWSKEGFRKENINKIEQDLKNKIVPNLIRLKVDWSMVKYEYDRQIKAKESF